MQALLAECTAAERKWQCGDAEQNQVSGQSSIVCIFRLHLFTVPQRLFFINQQYDAIGTDRSVQLAETAWRFQTALLRQCGSATISRRCYQLNNDYGSHHRYDTERSFRALETVFGPDFFAGVFTKV